MLVGFNGRIGSELAKILIKTYNVHCIQRSAPKMGINSIFLKFIDGDADNQNELEEAIDGKDLVVSAYGAGEHCLDNDKIEKYTDKLIEAMKKKVTLEFIT